MYLQLYDYDNNNASVQLSLGTCYEYDIPESGSKTDSKGRTWTITTNLVYGIYKKTRFVLPSRSKLINFGDFLATLHELVPTASPDGDELYTIYQNIGNGRLTPDEQTGSAPTRPYIFFESSYMWWYPAQGTADNESNYHGYNSPSESTMMVFNMSGSGDTEHGNYVYGTCAVYTTGGETGNSTIEIVRRLTFNDNTMNPPEREPGEEGFRPIGDHPVDKVIGGGTISGHTPKYQTDNISQPGAPDESAASAARLGFMRVYKISEANLNRVGELLFNPLARLQLNFPSNPIDAIVSLNIFPCAPDVGGEVTIGAFGYNMASQVLGVTAKGNPITTQFKTLDFGTVNVEEDWNSYLDYDATSVTLFLPFIGEVELPADEVVGSSVNVQYTIDFFTGMCVANVLIKKNVILASRRTVSHKTQHSYQGNCAINLPLTAVNYGTMIGSFVNAASSGLRTGMAGAAGSFASDVASGNFKPTITTKGTLSANAGYCGILYPYIIVTRPITTEPDNYQEVLGYPSYMENSIGACKGLCVCDDIKLNGITGATDSELSRIKQLCREGVYN